jgi:hypothetical protein
MMGKYTTESLRSISAERTEQAQAVIKNRGTRGAEFRQDRREGG